MLKEVCKTYSRLLVDNHITDLDPRFMAKFDPDQYIEAVKLAGVECVMVYACDHNGNCYYPTRTGHMHSGCRGRDILGENISRLKKAGRKVVIYTTIIYHNDCAKKHPEWRTDGYGGVFRNGRYFFCCPNHDDYLSYIEDHLREISAYPADGIFIDMTFYPVICRCSACREKFRREYGLDLPEKINWQDPCWVKYQRFREESISRCASRLTGFIRKIRPEITVAHQFSPVLHGWKLAQSLGVVLASDYASGDFYGDKYRQRLGCKVFDAYSINRPFEFLTSRCVNLNDHTSTKSPDELFLHALTTLANGGAYFFIDAIDPEGTLNFKFYRTLSELAEKLRPYRELIAAERPVNLAKVGVYFSMASNVDWDIKDIAPENVENMINNMARSGNPVVGEVIETGGVLNALHIPYRVITDAKPDLSGLEVLIVNNAAYLSPPELDSIRNFVAAGGILIATGLTSLYDIHGEGGQNFALADVFGVNYTGIDADKVSYLDIAGESISISGGRIPYVLPVDDTTTVLGGVRKLYFPADDPDRYASIHSNPPDGLTPYAGLTEHSFGKGKCIYLFAPVFGVPQFSQKSFVKQLLRKCIPEKLFVRSENLPESAEITLLESTSAKRLICCVVNYQEEQPNIPLYQVKLSITLPENFIPSGIKTVSGKPADFNFSNGILTLRLEKLEDAEFFLIY